MRRYPIGWTDPTADFKPSTAAGWEAAAAAPPFYLPLANRPARPVAVFARAAASVTAYAGNGCVNCWIVDYGRELQGGVNLSFTVPASTSTSASTSAPARNGEATAPAAAASCQQALQTDCNGDDIRKVANASDSMTAAVCCALCQHDAQCKVAVYVPQWQGQSLCELKSGCPGGGSVMQNRIALCPQKSVGTDSCPRPPVPTPPPTPDLHPGHTVTVMLAETVEADGRPVCPMPTGNNFTSQWTLRKGGPPQTVMQHEYVEFRYALVMNAPEPLTVENAGAWVIRYPLSDAPADDYGDKAELPASPLRRPAQLASFSSDSAKLNDVWGLARHTLVACGGLDVNVDSNTRQVRLALTVL
jgi:hypothetical protein